ncbi:MAG TPA: Do family serine endopeptidase [Bradyrhizobium sp.]|nr:Do family serine endopeptidase [Bradyrhizobium sp.]
MASVGAVGITTLALISVVALSGATSATPESVAGSTAAIGQELTSFADLVAKVKPAVISVRVKITKSTDMTDPVLPAPPGWQFFHFGPNAGERREIVTGEGSGFFISSDGYAVTNYHVVDHAKSVEVTTSDGTIYPAKVVGRDPKTDLALLKVEADKTFPFVQFAAHPPRVGDWVVAVGNPFGLGGTVTAGIVSARGRDIGSSTYDNYLQIDAPINKGNSGGPAFNMNGRVIGVNTAIFSPSGGSIGIGFDIPASTVKMVMSQLEQKGYVVRGLLGVQIQPMTPAIADSLGMKQAKGALVDEPQPNTPAAEAGIKSGDIITAVNGKPIKDARVLAQAIATDAPGTSIQLSVLRNGQTQTIDLKLAQMPEQKEANAQTSQQGDQQQAKPSSESHLGLSLAPARDVAGSGDNGVVVLGMDPNGPAAQSGMQVGDVILDAAGKAVETPSQVRDAVNETHSDGKHAILMRVKTAQGTNFIAVPIG